MTTCIGIDVAKQHVDLYDLDAKQAKRWKQTPTGIQQCVAFCKNATPQLVVMEATGGYEVTLAAALQAEGLPVAVVNPRRIRDFARAAGQIAKTDQLDAQIIARYGATLEPMPTERLDDNSRKMKALVARRQQLVQMYTAENNRAETGKIQVGSAYIKSIQVHILKPVMALSITDFSHVYGWTKQTLSLKVGFVGCMPGSPRGGSFK